MRKIKRLSKKYFMKIRKKLKPINCWDCFMIKVCEKYMKEDTKASEKSMKGNINNGLCGLLKQAEEIEDKWDETYGYDK